MTKLFRLGMSFLKHSKMLTFSAFFSIFIACFLGVGLFQLSSNIDRSIRTVIMEQVDEEVERHKDLGLSGQELQAVVEEGMADYWGMHRFLTILYGLAVGDPADPPGIARLLMVLPPIQRIAPELSGDTEGIRRTARHAHGHIVLI